MPIQTITEPSADDQKIDLYNARMRRSNVEQLQPAGKYALVLIKLAAGVNQPGDYAALGAAIDAITGIAGVRLLIDGQAPASIPAGTQLNLIVSAHLRIDGAPGG